MAMQLFSGFNSSAQEIYYNTVVEKTFKMIVDNQTYDGIPCFLYEKDYAELRR